MRPGKPSDYVITRLVVLLLAAIVVLGAYLTAVKHHFLERAVI